MKIMTTDERATAKFLGNPTRSYRSTSSFKIVGEVTNWQGPEPVKAMKDALVKLKEQGINSLNDK